MSSLITSSVSGALLLTSMAVGAFAVDSVMKADAATRLAEDRAIPSIGTSPITVNDYREAKRNIDLYLPDPRVSVTATKRGLSIKAPMGAYAAWREAAHNVAGSLEGVVWHAPQICIGLKEACKGKLYLQATGSRYKVTTP